MTPRTSTHHQLFAATIELGGHWPLGIKCDRILRAVLEANGALDFAAEEALCNTSYESPVVGQLYDQLRELVNQGLLFGRGDLRLPAGPRYTECGITPAGREILADVDTLRRSDGI